MPSMIVRIWLTRIPAEREAEYLTFAQQHSRKMFLSQPGCLGVLFLKEVDEKHAVCSFWNSRSDVEMLANSPTYNATVADLTATGVLAGEATVTVYDIEGGGIDNTSFTATLEKLGLLTLPEKR